MKKPTIAEMNHEQLAKAHDALQEAFEARRRKPTGRGWGRVVGAYRKNLARYQDRAVELMKQAHCARLAFNEEWLGMWDTASLERVSGLRWNEVLTVYGGPR